MDLGFINFLMRFHVNVNDRIDTRKQLYIIYILFDIKIIFITLLFI